MHGRQHKSLDTQCIVSTLRSRPNGNICQCICILVFLFVVADGLLNSSDPLVNTRWGTIRGKWSRSLRDRLVANFLGIPYALPPVGNLRFKNPQRWNRLWTTTRNATVDGQACAQLDKTSEILGSEDCLYLNVFVPYIPASQQRSVKLPVLVYVHGGAFSFGSSSSTLYAPDYLMDQDVILVTMNYRLNILGFFSTANQVSPGNYGLKDVKMALEWIQENIHNFNGDPESVTCMGHSAGAATIHLLAITHKTEGLFHKYILHSGSALNWFAFAPKKRIYRQICLEVARLVGCVPEKSDDIVASNETTTENFTEEYEKTGSVYDYVWYNTDNYSIKDDEEIMKCMRKTDMRKILNTLERFLVWEHNPYVPFGPTLEDESKDAILTMSPMEIIKNGLFRDIPAIMQVVKDEGLVKTAEEDTEDEVIENFEKYLPYILEIQYRAYNSSILTAAIQDFYFNGNLTLDFTQKFTQMVSETMIHAVFQAVQYQSELGKSNIYFSFFTYEGTYTFTFSSNSSCHYGISHGDDINYMFPVLNNIYQNLSLRNTEYDITTIDIMTEMWTNFMVEGVPRAWMIPAWPAYRDHHQFMRFGRLPDIVVEADFLPDRMKFWEELKANLSIEAAAPDNIFDNSLEDKLLGNADMISFNLTVHLIILIIALLIILNIT